MLGICGIALGAEPEMQTSNRACSPRVRNLDDKRLIASADAIGLAASGVRIAAAMIVICWIALMVLPIFGGWVEFDLPWSERAFFEVGAVLEDAACAFFGCFIWIIGFIALVLVLSLIVFWFWLIAV